MFNDRFIMNTYGALNTLTNVMYAADRIQGETIEDKELQAVFYLLYDDMNAKQYNKYKCLGLNIAYYRKERGISQMRLAELINISRTHMSRIETAECAVSLDVVFEICDVLRVSPDKIFNFRMD